MTHTPLARNDARLRVAGAVLAAVVMLAACKTTPSSQRSDRSPDGMTDMRAAPAPPRHRARPARRASGARAFDHTGLDRLLGRYVDAQGRVAYGRWLKNAADLTGLDGYLETLASARPLTLSKGGQKAFWINAYNAYVLRGVLDALPGKPSFSVSDDHFRFFDEVRYAVAGRKMSLNEIENGVLRGDWSHASLKKTPAKRLERIKALHGGVGRVDPRIHFALVCASRGCPSLRASAFTGAKIAAQLEAETRAYVNTPTRGAGPQGISALFFWFKKDFVAAGTPPREFIAKYYRGDLSKIAFGKQLPYSWKLNRQ